MSLVICGWLLLEVLNFTNILAPLVQISYPLPLSEDDQGLQRYGKGPKDLLFLAYYVIVFSFIRQVALQYVITPVARSCGIPTGRKLERFNEQGYAFLYWSTSSVIGLVGIDIDTSFKSTALTSLLDRWSCQTNRHGGTTQKPSGLTILIGACAPN